MSINLSIALVQAFRHFKWELCEEFEQFFLSTNDKITVYLKKKKKTGMR